MMRLKPVYLIAFFLLHVYKTDAQSYDLSARKTIKARYHVSSPETKSTLLLYEDNTFVHYGSTISSKQKNQQLWYTTGKWLSNKELVMCRTYPDTLNRDLLYAELKKSYPPEKKVRKMKELPLQRLEYMNYIFLFEGSNLRDKSSNLFYTAER